MNVERNRETVRSGGVADRRPARCLAAFAAAAFAASLALVAGRAAAQVGFPGGPVDAVQVEAVPLTASVEPGGKLPVAVVFDFKPTFHAWPNEPVIPEAFGADFPAIPTTIIPAAVPPGIQLGAVQWPEPHAVQVDYGTGPIDLLSYSGQTVAYVPVLVPPDHAPGEVALDFDVGYQVCDATSCYPPETIRLRVPLTIAALGSAAVPAAAGMFDAFDPAGYEPAAPGGAVAGANVDGVAINFFGRSFTLQPEAGLGFAVLLLVAALGGILLNFTPCVLPVLPLKVMALSRAAGDTRRLGLLGACMALGVVMFWLAIGAAIAWVAGFDAISSLFQTGWFALVVGIVVAAMAVSMLGVFDFNPPQWAYRVQPSQDTAQGSFLFGVMTAVLATPCTAPLMGSASAWAATQAPPVTLATFGAIGAGMALPYLLLSLRPQLVHSVPRSGPASVLVKQVMGLFMLAVAAFFVGTALAAWLHTPPDPVDRRYWFVVVALVVAGCAWLVYRTFQITRSTPRRVVFGGLGMAVALFSLGAVGGLTSQGPIDWVYFTPARFAEAQGRGDVVVMDFTAEWCLNCKALEAGVLHQPPVVDLLDQPGVTPMKVDLTGSNPEGWAMLAQLRSVGIPLLAVFGPTTGYADTPLKYDSYTVETVQTAVGQATTAVSGVP